MHWRSTFFPIVGLACLALAALPSLAVEEDVDSTVAPSCSRSLLQQSAVDARPSQLAESSKERTVLAAITKVRQPPSTKTPLALSQAVAKSLPKGSGTAEAKVAASGKTNLAQHTVENSPRKSGLVRALEKEDARQKAHATAKMLVEFAVTAWEVLIVVLVIALIVLAVGAYTTAGRKEYEWNQDPREFGFRHNITRDVYNNSQYATKPVQYGERYSRDSLDKNDPDCCGCFAPPPKKQNLPRQYNPQPQRH